MAFVTIRKTQNPSILKFELEEFITRNQNFEFKNIDDAKDSPLAQQLFFLPFVKTVYISGNFIAIERYNIVEWDDVQEGVKEQIEVFLTQGKSILSDSLLNQKKTPITIYAESTPNPAVLKFVANKLLTKKTAEFKNIDETAASPLAREIFKFPFVKEVFIDENYISISKYDINDWQEVSGELRAFIKEFLEKGGIVIDETLISESSKQEKQEIKNFEQLDVTSQQIINILEEYVKPAVQSDGGNILFDSYNENDKIVKVILQGACSGCPSSTFTLKNGIEAMLRDMLKNDGLKVEAINA